jgi:SAM-dependent methyltransferase
MVLNERQQREKEFWDKKATVDMHADWKEKPFETWKTVRPIRQTALDWLGPIAGKKLLMCGVGSEAAIFARAGAQVYGFDISDSQILAVQTLARRLNLEDRIEARSMPFEDLQYPDSYFDVVFGQAILHHIDLVRGAAELNRVMKPGARATFIEPLGMNPLLQFARRHLPYRGKGRTEDEEPLKYPEIELFMKYFADAKYQEFGLLSMVRRRVTKNRAVVGFLERCDVVLLERFPGLRRLCREVWIGVGTAPFSASSTAAVANRPSPGAPLE